MGGGGLGGAGGLRPGRRRRGATPARTAAARPPSPAAAFVCVAPLVRGGGDLQDRCLAIFYLRRHRPDVIAKSCNQGRMHDKMTTRRDAMIDSRSNDSEYQRAVQINLAKMHLPTGGADGYRHMQPSAFSSPYAAKSHFPSQTRGCTESTDSMRLQSCIDSTRNYPRCGAAREGLSDLKGGVAGLQGEHEVLLRKLEHPQVQRLAPPLELLHRLRFGVDRRLPSSTHPPAAAPRSTPPPRSSLAWTRRGRQGET